MRHAIRLAAMLSVAAALSACQPGEDEQPFNEQFDATISEIENKARLLEVEAANSVNSQVEALEAETRQLLEPPPPANVAIEANQAAPAAGEER